MLGFEDMDSIYATPKDFRDLEEREKKRALHLLKHFVDRCHQIGVLWKMRTWEFFIFYFWYKGSFDNHVPTYILKFKIDKKKLNISKANFLDLFYF